MVDFIAPGIYTKEIQEDAFNIPLNQFNIGFSGVFKKGFVGKPILVNAQNFIRIMGDGKPTSTQDSSITNDHMALRLMTNATSSVLVSRAIRVDDVTGFSSDTTASVELLLDTVGNNKCYKLEIPKNAILAGGVTPNITTDLIFTINIDGRGIVTVNNLDGSGTPITDIDTILTAINAEIDAVYTTTAPNNIASKSGTKLILTSPVFSSSSSIVTNLTGPQITQLFGDADLSPIQYGNNGFDSKSTIIKITNDGSYWSKVAGASGVASPVTIKQVSIEKTKSIVFVEYDNATDILPTVNYTTIVYTIVGASTSTSTNLLIDSSANFNKELIGKKVFTGISTYATITSVNSPNILTLDSNLITAVGTGYTIGLDWEGSSSKAVNQYKLSSYSSQSLFRETTETKVTTFSSKVGGIPISVKNVYNYFDNGFSFTPTSTSIPGMSIFAKSPGSWGNNLKIYFLTKDYIESEFGSYYKGLFNGREWKTTEFGLIIEENGELLEKHICCLNNSDLNENRQTYFFEDVTKNQSAYITMFSNNVTFTSITNQSKIFNLVNGLDSITHSEYDIVNAYKVFMPNEIKTKLMFVGGSHYNSDQLSIIMQNVIRDLVLENGILKKLDVFFPANVPYEIINTFDPYASIISWSSFKFGITEPISCTKYEIHDTYFTVANPYGGKDIIIPKSIMMVSNMVNTIVNSGEWEAYAWKSRGAIGGVKKAIWTATTLTEKEGLYLAKINPTYTSNDVSYFNAGNKTDSIDGSFTRTNQRLLFNLLEELGFGVADNFVFDRNTPTTRAACILLYSLMLQPYVDKGAIGYFNVICDSSNNTPDILAKNQMAVNVSVGYYTTAEIIVQTFYAKAVS